jgi:hypothetical protein
MVERAHPIAASRTVPVLSQEQFRVQGAGFTVQGLGYRVYGLGFRV